MMMIILMANMIMMMMMIVMPPRRIELISELTNDKNVNTGKQLNLDIVVDTAFCNSVSFELFTLRSKSGHVSFLFSDQSGSFCFAISHSAYFSNGIFALKGWVCKNVNPISLNAKFQVFILKRK